MNQWETDSEGPKSSPHELLGKCKPYAGPQQEAISQFFFCHEIFQGWHNIFPPVFLFVFVPRRGIKQKVRRQNGVASSQLDDVVLLKVHECNLRLMNMRMCGGKDIVDLAIREDKGIRKLTSLIKDIKVLTLWAPERKLALAMLVGWVTTHCKSFLVLSRSAKAGG